MAGGFQLKNLCATTRSCWCRFLLLLQKGTEELVSDTDPMMFICRFKVEFRSALVVIVKKNVTLEGGLTTEVVMVSLP